MSDAATKKAYTTVLGLTRPTITLRPLATGAGAVDGVVLTPGAGAWGAYADIIAAAAITTEFWCLECIFGASGGIVHGLREVQIYNATALVFVYSCRVDLTAATSNVSPFEIPLPVHCNANAQVQGRAGAANATDTIRCSLLVATGV